MSCSVISNFILRFVSRGIKIINVKLILWPRLLTNLWNEFSILLIAKHFEVPKLQSERGVKVNSAQKCFEKCSYFLFNLFCVITESRHDIRDHVMIFGYS